MNYCNIKNIDSANGEGVRVSLFVSGCRHHCKGCFQPETWNFSYGEEFTKETEDKLIEMLRPDFIDGLTLLGGEPMEPENQRGLFNFLKRVKSELPEKTIWCFSGYLLDEELLKPSSARIEITDEILSMIDVLVDGEFRLERKNVAIAFRGSDNQRIIDLKESLKRNEIVFHKLHFKGLSNKKNS